jgi:hypothetical protein
MLLHFLKFTKVIGVALLFSGSIGTVLSTSHADRRRFAYALAGPGFWITWLSGVFLLIATDGSPLTLWVIGSMILSIVSLNAVLYLVGKEGRRSGIASALVIVPLLCCVALMTFKP